MLPIVRYAAAYCVVAVLCRAAVVAGEEDAVYEDRSESSDAYEVTDESERRFSRKFVVNDYDLSVLSKQVKALVERRTEDLRSIEENVRKTVFNGPEVEELRDQVRSLRLEIEQLRSGVPPTPPPQTKNDKLTLKWLSNALYEVKSEISELQTTLNGSVLLSDRERHESKMKLFKSDISNLNEELERMRVRNAQQEADLSILKMEVETLKGDLRSAAADNGQLKNEMQSLQAEWNNNWKAIQDIELQLPVSNDTHSRHQRILRKHLLRLERVTRLLHKENISLKNRLIKVEKGMSLKENTDSFDRINGNDIQNYIETNQIQPLYDDRKEILCKRFTNLSEQQIINTKSIANLTKQMINFDKLHMSMLELLENVETLENKVDKAFPEFRIEISKVENQAIQVSSDISLLKEDRNNIRDSMKAISFSVSKLQEGEAEKNERIGKMEEHLKVMEKSAVVQNSRLHDHILKDESSSINLNATKSTIHLVEELKSFESEYKSIVNKLPRHCGSVDGPKGIYLISPGDGEPILAHCEDGWTTIQKRYDGSVNFNRNWNEYSNGFGSSTGEHWLGNRNLHQLTKDNCTSLQINMKDIYGKYWQASYDHFTVADFREGFRLVVSHYHGNASDAMDYQNKMEFSTVDNDRDISNTHCASNYEGGWWFSHCQHANLNGRYNLGLTWFDSSRNEWIAVAQSEMKVKRRNVC
ncbi:protein scabrous [Sitophilus oryzae]|uniref:Protein scabrous n=1 Tax=Sitophilus oryzae TaxID=7048 RepID=A0A6J2YC30_SITOR|nr:protein scabrous [Sitophilus oryzae]